MRINLNDPKDFTIENLRKLIATEDDSVHTQFRVTADEFLFLSRKVGNQSTEGLAFRLVTHSRGNGYVGKEASQDDEWVNKVYDVIQKNWPSPNDTFVDVY